MLAVFILSVLALTVPTLMVIFYKIPTFWFKFINTAGVILATLRIALSLIIGVTNEAVKGQGTPFKKKLDKEALLLFVLILVFQFINLALIHP
ncbi:hypothetical protein [Lysinibacillus xylanilyticus]|uniref:hypothetical protein n=1 Tax=Lysinibacillus xylanilyticus TaxID=582475 RepID=UPI0036DCD07E